MYWSPARVIQLERRKGVKDKVKGPPKASQVPQLASGLGNLTISIEKSLLSHFNIPSWSGQHEKWESWWYQIFWRMSMHSKDGEHTIHIAFTVKVQCTMYNIQYTIYNIHITTLKGKNYIIDRCWCIFRRWSIENLFCKRNIFNTERCKTRLPSRR